MADFSVTLTVPNDKVNDLVAALRWHWGEKSPGVEYTQNELRAKLKTSVESSLHDIFRRHKEHLRAQTPIDATLGLT
jgi:hypothetical protein